MTPTPPALHALGLARLGTGDADGALGLLERAHRLAPGDSDLQLHLGAALRALGRHAEAAALFRSALSALPDDPAPCINLAGSLLALGDPGGALRSASEACHRAPGLSAAHYCYGQAWLALRDWARAVQAFHAAVALTPDFADAWVNLGLARYRMGAIEDAKLCMRRALRVSPGHRAATGNLGVFLRLTGRPEAAETLLCEALRRDPDAAEIRIGIASEWLRNDRPEEALLLLEHPAPFDREQQAQWSLLRAAAMLRVGQTAEARTIIARIEHPGPGLAPLLLWRRLLLALADADRPEAERLAQEIEACLDAGGEAVQPEHQIGLAFNLAKFWSGAGAPARAMGLWTRGHQRLRPYQPFLRPTYEAFVDANIEAFEAGRWRTGARAANADPAPVFIVGMPRSGTTLAEQILAAHRAVHGAGERLALADMFEALGGARDTAQAALRVSRLDASALDGAATSYLQGLHALAPGRGRIVDKMPGNFNQLGLVGAMLPGARIIHCTRDPRDVGLSIFSYRFLGHHPYAHDLADLGWAIGQHDRLMAHWTACLPNPILTVRLDDWVEDFPATLARVLAFLGLDHDPACERFHEHERPVSSASRHQVRQPINARGIGRWRGYAEPLAPLIEELERAGALQGWPAA